MAVENLVGGWLFGIIIFVAALVAILFGLFDRSTPFGVPGRMFLVSVGIPLIVAGVFWAIFMSKQS
jgi:hypothetical protein